MPLVTSIFILALLSKPISCFQASPRKHISHHHSFVRSSATVSPENSARQSGLALLLDDGTRKSHSVAENTAFVTGFFKGIGDKESFAQLVTSLYFIYEAMESCFDELREEVASKPDAEAAGCVVALDFQELRRTPTLEKDMVYFFGESWRSKVKPSVATVAYCNRIREISKDSSLAYLLVAHQYTRYLGDLFGGQMMGGMATRSLGLEDGKGVEFYNFEGIPNAKAFINTWYQDLNKLPLSERQQAALVDEANLVFALNIAIFEELDGNPVAALWQMAKSAVMAKFKATVGARQ